MYLRVMELKGVDNSAAICHFRSLVGAGGMLSKIFTSPGAQPIVDIVT